MWEISRRKCQVKKVSSWCQCQTLVLHNKVKTIAIELADHRLFVKLSKGDMVATEVVYHLKCLNELYLEVFK